MKSNTVIYFEKKKSEALFKEGVYGGNQPTKDKLLFLKVRKREM